MNVNEPSRRSESPDLVQDELLARYAKQVRFVGIGPAGQRRLAEGSAVVIGCGALGSVTASTLVRSGVGRVRIVDRDFVELDNLQRQVLYEEADVGQPKAIQAAAHLGRVNSSVEIEPLVADCDFTNIRSLVEGMQVVVDGTDNFETRFLINDACVEGGIPWVFGGCLGAEGQAMTVVPGQTACLRCLMPEGPPAPGESPTCDSAGIIGPIINLIASVQATEAIKILSGNQNKIHCGLQVFDLWGNRSSRVDLSGLRDKVDCPVCRGARFEWLTGERGSQSSILCGRNAVQLNFSDRQPVRLAEVATRWEGLGRVETGSHLVRLHLAEHVITLFSDGRAIIQGTDQISLAKRLYSQYVGL